MQSILFCHTTSHLQSDNMLFILRCECIHIQVPLSPTFGKDYRGTVAENYEVDKDLLQTSNKRSKNVIYRLKKKENTTESLMLYTAIDQTEEQQECVPNMINLLPTCPLFSEVIGSPVSCLSNQYVTYTIEWPTNVHIIWEKLKCTKNILLMPYLEKSHSWLSLMDTCPNKSRIPGFASAKITKELGMHVMHELWPSCLETSIVIATPLRSIITEDKHHGEWHGMKTSFLEQYTIQKSNSKEISIQSCEMSMQEHLLSTYPNESIVSEMKRDIDVECENKTPDETIQAQCQKPAQMLDFNPVAQTEASMLEILPSFPMFSRIHGCPSLRDLPVTEWKSEKLVISYRSLKKISTGILDIGKHINHSKIIAMAPTYPQASSIPGFLLAPTCPSLAFVPGFPSVPKSKMLCILPTVPKKSKIIGFSSKQQSEYLDRSNDKKMLYCRPLQNKTVGMAERLDWINNLSTIMFPLTRTCLLQTSIPGFPYAPMHKAELPPTVINLHQCVPKMSKIIGFSSSERLNTVMWLNDEMSLLEKPLKTKPDLPFQFSLDLPSEQVDRHVLQKMFSMVPTCLREVSIQGFPSLTHVKVEDFYLNKEPDIVILLPSCPLLSLKEGIPSVTSVSIEKCQVSIWSSLKCMWVEVLKEKPVLSFGSTLEFGEYLKTMFLLAPTCADKAQSSGFPCSVWPKKEHTMTSPEAPLPATDEILFNNMVTEVLCGPVEAKLLDVPDSTRSLTSVLGSPTQHNKYESKFTQHIESERNQMLDMKETGKRHS